MTDTVVGGVSDVAGTAVPARVAEQAPPEPFVGSGARVPAKLRLVLAGYVGIACGWFAAALACAAVAVSIFVFVFVDGDEPESVIGVLVYLVSTGRGYQSLSEVPLALWLKAGMLVPVRR